MNIFKNTPLKLLSVLAALILWLFVVGVENYVHTFPINMPVKIINLGHNVSVANEIETVKVLYKNPRDSVIANANDFELFLDAKGLGEGDHSLPVGYNSKNVNLAVVAVIPSRLELKLEAMTSKNISLKSEIIGSPAKDYELKSLKLNVDKVNLNGAASAISGLKSLPIKISLDGTETAGFSRKITLEAPSDWKLSGKTVSFDPPIILANIEIQKKKEAAVSTPENTTDVTTAPDGQTVPVTTGNARKTLMADVTTTADLAASVKELLPKNILVTVEGKADTLATLDNKSIQLLIKTPDVQKGVYTVTASDIVLPVGTDLKIISFSPEKVLVKF